MYKTTLKYKNRTIDYVRFIIYEFQNGIGLNVRLFLTIFRLVVRDVCTKRVNVPFYFLYNSSEFTDENVYELDDYLSVLNVSFKKKINTPNRPRRYR